MNNTKKPLTAAGSRAFGAEDLTGLLDRPVAYHRIFAHVCGDPVAAIFLSQAFFWSPRTKNVEGWFYKTQAEWFEETGLTRRHQETARKKLVSLGILEEVRRGLPAQLFFRLNLPRLAELIRAFLDSKNGGDSSGEDEENEQSRKAQSANLETPKSQDRMAQSAKQESQQAPDKQGATAQTLTEAKNTTENTPKTTTTDAVVADLLFQMKGCGVSERVAMSLIAEKPEQCRLQLEWLPLREVQKPCGALVAAIREEWAPPEQVQELARQKEAAQKREETRLVEATRKADEEAERRAQEAQLSEENCQIDAYFADLPATEKQAIEAETKRRLGVLGSRASEGAFQAMRRNLLRPDLGFSSL
ncbi:MAG TPA: hypothetical protein VF627_09190 [Abditibacterium sp.]|jgi:hypothetical protein